MKEEFRVLARACGSCGCGCPTIMETAGGIVVVVGAAKDAVLQSPEVQRRIGEGEAAIVIPKSLLLEALHTLQS